MDKIRDTANSHDRIFFIEVMGRDAGFLAQNSAIASGAEAAIIPESATDVDQLADFIERGKRKSKNSAIVLVSEAQKDGVGGAFYYAERVKKEYPQFDARVTILGHLQRGGTPSAYDRILASRMGYAAIEALLEGQRNIMIGIKNDDSGTSGLWYRPPESMFCSFTRMNIPRKLRWSLLSRKSAVWRKVALKRL